MARDRGILRLMTRSPHDAVTPPAAAAPPCVESSAKAEAAPSTAVAPEPAQSEAARAKAEKAMRMAAALRANLKRRKAPARTPAAPRDSN
ncbi:MULTISPECIES: hypothetical protein [unclassified Brevundimonas]|uniref:hypothetical protein n=1 Tax=unclassified Brevundimonas TaxID=2622653 RepID=UPI002004D84C|nr:MULTISPECIES: hypothetical protein [unclassified Brevundimonas]